MGLAKLLEENLSLRDVVQAMRYIRSRMFSPVPSTGFNSTRTAEVLNYRATTAPLVTVGHLNAVLRSPGKVERELAELTLKGVVRKVRVERRGGMGEALIETLGTAAAEAEGDPSVKTLGAALASLQRRSDTVRDQADRLATWLGSSLPGWEEIALACFEGWASKVSRYSYRFHKTIPAGSEVG